jgi:hypothetical protein
LAFRLKENSLCARIAAWKLSSDKVAIVFGSTIHLYNTTEEEFLSNKKWVNHEQKHIEQYKRYGFFTFIFLYLLESMRNGYINNKFEIEAREAEKDDSTNYLK